MRELRSISVAILVLLVLGVQFCALGSTWVGSVSDDWNESGNWSPAVLPSSGDAVGIGSSKTNYWPVIYDNHYNGSAVVPGPDAQGFNAYCGLLSMSELSGNSQLTIDSGKLYFSSNNYMIVGRHSGDTALLTINGGGVGAYNGGTLYGATRWLRIGRGDSSGGGLGTMIMNGGKVYTQAMDVGAPDGSGDAGSSATINDGAELYVGVGYNEASFGIGPTASMTINPGGYVEIDSDRLWDSQYVQAKGALNIVADSSGSGTLIIPWVVSNAAELRAYFGYDSTGGNVNAIYNGGAGEFVFSYPGGIFTEITVIPEPATLALIAFGGFVFVRRRR